MNRTDSSRAGRSLAMNIIQYRTGTLGLLAVVLAAGAPARAQSWTSYDPSLGTLPEAQGWTFFENDGPPSPVVEDGVLKQGPTGSGCTSNYEYWYRSDVPIDFGATVTLEASLRVISSSYADGTACGDFGCSGGTPSWKPGYIIAINDADERVLKVGFTSTGVVVDPGCCFCPEDAPVLPFDTTDGFHLYRIVIGSGVVSLFVDNQLLHTVSLGTALNPGAANSVSFGDATHLGSSQTELSFLRYTTDPTAAGIPTISEWGMIAMTLLMLTSGTVLLGRGRRSRLAM